MKLEIYNLLAECSRSGLKLTGDGGLIHISPPDKLTPSLRARLEAAKLDLLPVLAMPMVSRVRQRFALTCRELGINSTSVLARFDCWRYLESDLNEMQAWSPDTVEAHCRLLANEQRRIAR